MAKDSETDLLIPKGFQTQNIFIPVTAFEKLVTDLPLSADLIRTLEFFKFSKLGDLHSITYGKIWNKFINVNLRRYNLIAELYTFLTSLQSTETSRLTGNENGSEKEEGFFETPPEKEKTEICNQEKAENPEIKYSQGEIEGRSENFIDWACASRLMLAESQAGEEEDRERLFQRMITGGYPEAVGRKSAARREAWFGSYITTLLQRDVRHLANIEGLTDLPRLLSILAARADGLLN